MRELTHERLRRMTLSRQFPRIRGHGPAAVLQLVDRLGPIQSQVPRTPFIALAARLPGVSYATLTALFEKYQLLKTSNLRGTVHTSTRRNFGWLDAVARQQRAPALRKQLNLQRLTPADVTDEIERFCKDEWRQRKDLAAHISGWLTERESWAGAAGVDQAIVANLLWGHSGLLRRPRGSAWEKRTDNFHRTARSLVPEMPTSDPVSALAELVHRHLAAYGPVTRQDLAFFFGTGLGRVDAAAASLGDVVVRLPGPENETYLDLADPPTDGTPDPGIRLLPEFDGLLVGFHGRHRTRFVEQHQLTKVWAKVNGLFSPVVLDEGRLVATWKTLSSRGSSVIEVTMLAPFRPLPEDAFGGAVAAVEVALNLTVSHIRVFGDR